MNTKHASFDKPWRSLGAQRRRRPVALQLLGLAPHEANHLERPAGPRPITQSISSVDVLHVTITTAT